MITPPKAGTALVFARMKRSDTVELVVVAVALGLLAGIVAGVFLNASLPVTILVVVGVLIVAGLVSQVL